MTVCGECKKTNKKYVPVDWCPDCEKSFCYVCLQRHMQSRLSREHETISHENYLKLPPLIKNISMKCPEHKERFDHFCRDHDQLICNGCRKRNHKNCKEVSFLGDIVTNVKTSYAFDGVILEITRTCQVLQNCVKECQIKLTEIDNQKGEMITALQKTVDEIINHLEQLKKNTITNIETKVERYENEVLKSLEQLQTMEAKTSGVLDQIESIKQYASNTQTFLCIKELENFVFESKNSLEKMFESKALDHINLFLNNKPEIETLFPSTNLLGDVKVFIKPTTLTIEPSEPNQAQNPASRKNQISLRHEHDIEVEEVLDGVCTLPNGMVALTSYSDKQLKLFNPDRTMKFSIRFRDEPYDVTPVNEDQVAISHPSAEIISIVDVPREKVIKTLSTWDKVTGIAYKDDHHILFCVPGFGIKRLNINTVTINDIITDRNVSYDSHVVVARDRICYTCPETTNEVIVLDSKYKVMFKYQDQATLEKPVGLTIDNNNNILVVGRSSHNLIAIFPEDKSANQLLSVENDLNYPTAVNYNHHTKELVVITDDMGMVRIYAME